MSCDHVDRIRLNSGHEPVAGSRGNAHKRLDSIKGEKFRQLLVDYWLLSTDSAAWS
jgi:hypothetical protein